jgi:hypothetical protein
VLLVAVVVLVLLAATGAVAWRALAPEPPPEPPGGVLIGAGDIASCDLDADAATARLLGAMDGTVFVAGDAAYETGSLEEFEECYGPTWGRYLDRTRFVAAGNHEYLTDGAAGYRQYFGRRAVPDETTWYSDELGDWHVIVLDSNCDHVDCGDGSPQLEWLRADLAETTAACTVAIWHHPRFSSGGRHGNNEAVDPFWRVLYEAGADVIVSAHDHSYERFAPQDPDANPDPERGIRQFVVGTGGGPLVEQAASQPNSEADEDDTHGVLRLELRSSSYSWAFVPVRDGAFTDEGAADCH